MVVVVSRDSKSHQTKEQISKSTIYLYFSDSVRIPLMHPFALFVKLVMKGNYVDAIFISLCHILNIVGYVLSKYMNRIK